MKIVKILIGLILALTVAVTAALVLTRPGPLPTGSDSAARLRPGPYSVHLSEFVWVDESRPTDANGDYPGSPQRSFEVALWSPVDAPGPHPLVVFSHGFVSTRHAGTHLGEHLASHGYVVVSADYPLTHFGAPGGPNADDVIHQPADVSFLIDSVLALTADKSPFSGGIDAARIGVMGTSLGGLTSTLAAYHPRFGDPRIRAAISIAGPTMLFEDRFFASRDVPFLMIGGTHDTMIGFEENAAPIPQKVRRGGLLAIKGGSHVGFSYLAAGPLRILGNPDRIGCVVLLANLHGEKPFAGLGGTEEGIIAEPDSTLPCETEFDETMNAGRQNRLTALAVRAFFESYFAQDEATRMIHSRFLAETFQAEIPEVRFTPARDRS